MESSQVKAYPRPPYRAQSDFYQISVDGNEVPAAMFKEVHFARLGFEGRVEFTISVDRTITRFEISPRSFGIKARVVENTLSFQLTQDGHDRPYYLVVRINEGPILLVFADRLIHDSLDYNNPRRLAVVEAGDFGIDPSGKACSQRGIQQAIDKAHQDGGGVVALRNGVYKVAGLLLKSQVTLYLEHGAFLVGDDDLSQYIGRLAPYHRDPRGINPLLVIPPFIDIRNAHHVAVAGAGVIDCNNSAITTGKTMNHRTSNYRRHLLATWDCSDVRIEGVTALDAEWWCTRLNRSRNLHVKRYKVITSLQRRTNDGINLEGSRDSLVEECFTYTGDDGLNSKASWDDHPTTNVTFRNSIVYSGEIGLQLGWEDSADICDIRYENIDIVYSKMPLGMFTGVSVQTKIGGIHHVSFTDIRAEKVDPPVWNSHNQDTTHYRSSRPFTFCNMLQGVSIHDIHLKNVSILWNNAPLPIALRGLNERDRTSRITFENVTIEGQRLRRLDDCLFDTNEYIDDIRFQSESEVSNA